MTTLLSAAPSVAKDEIVCDIKRALEVGNVSIAQQLQRSFLAMQKRDLRVAPSERLPSIEVRSGKVDWFYATEPDGSMLQTVHVVVKMLGGGGIISFSKFDEFARNIPVLRVGDKTYRSWKKFECYIFVPDNRAVGGFRKERHVFEAVDTEIPIRDVERMKEIPIYFYCDYSNVFTVVAQVPKTNEGHCVIGLTFAQQQNPVK